jgi:hypothetical protein
MNRPAAGDKRPNKRSITVQAASLHENPGLTSQTLPANRLAALEIRPPWPRAANEREEGFGVGVLLDADGQPLKDGPPPAAGAASPEHLANDLEAMGPTCVTLGQVLAGRRDLLPDVADLLD